MAYLISILLNIICLILLWLAPLSAQQVEPQVEVRLAGGIEGGTYYDIALYTQELSRDGRVKINMVPTKGSWDNLDLLCAGNVEFALVQLDAAIKHNYYNNDPDLKAIRPLYTEFLHVILRDPLDMLDLSEVSGKNIFYGATRSGTAITSRNILEMIGITPGKYQRIPIGDNNYNDIIRFFQEDSIDVIMYTGALGNEFITTLMNSTPGKLFSLDAETIQKLIIEKDIVLSKIMNVENIPPDTYNRQERIIRAVTIPVVLLSQNHISDRIISAVDSVVLKAVDSLRMAGHQGQLEKAENVILPVSNLKSHDPVQWSKNRSVFRFWIELAVIVGILALLVWGGLTKAHVIARLFQIQKISMYLTATAVVSLICAVGIYGLEHSVNRHFESLHETMWSMLVYLTSGLEDRVPITPWGKVMASILLVVGPVFLTMLAGFFASSIIIKKLGYKMDKHSKNHCLILNWSRYSLDVIRQLHSPTLSQKRDISIVVMSDDSTLNLKQLHDSFKEAESEAEFKNVTFCPGDPCDTKCLAGANVAKAESVLIMNDHKDEEHPSDEKTIRTLMMLRELLEKETEKQRKRHSGKNKMVKMPNIIVELVNLENCTVIDCIEKIFPGTIDYVSGNRIRTLLLSQAVYTPGLSKFYRDLLSFDEDSNEVYSVKIPDGAVNENFYEYASAILMHNREPWMIPVGLRRRINGRPKPITNPKPKIDNERNGKSYTLQKDDEILVLAYRPPETEDLPQGILDADK
jgi:TRAP transporter TAXI family solute receptor